MVSIHKIAIVYREDELKSGKEATKLADQVCQWLLKQNHKVYSLKDQKLNGSQKIRGARELDALTLMLVLGGDGTYLKALHALQGREVPVMGANFGTLGFLTEISARHVYEKTNDFFAGKLTPTPRTLLEVKIETKSKTLFSTLALNDVVVERGNGTHLIDMSVHSGKFLVSRLRADGLIISTPTGSTAYNLSAGGPIIHPDVPAIVVTPVCPHSLTAKSITLPDQHVITLKLNRGDQKAKVMVDGQHGIEINSNSKVKVKKSKIKHLMIASDTYDFFELLNSKLEFGHRR